MVEERVTRKLAAIFYADVAGYSRLTGEDEEGTHRTLSAYLDAITSVIEGHGGRVLHYAGDAILAEFASVVVAVTCAVEVQRDLADRNKDLPDDRKVQFRIGVNLGDVIVDRDDIYGDGVNVAARLESLADPGGICVSRKVLDEVQGKIDIGFEDMGSQQVKNIAEPVHTYRVILERPSAVLAAAPMPDKPSIAVLPFVNLSGDPEQAFFADGMAEDAITGLSRFPSLRVIARNSTFAYKGQSPDIRTVARDLGVRYVLEGSVRRGGERIRITAQLIDARTGNHLWAERYDRDLEDIFAVQDEVTDTIVATIAPEIGRAERKRALRKPPETLDVWNIYQRGLAEYYSATKQGQAAAVELFDEASARDPNFALAFAMGAEARLRLARLNPMVENREALIAQAREKAQKAVALEPRDSVCLVADGRAMTHSGQHRAAISRIEGAIALNPNFATAHFSLGAALVPAGRPEEAIVHFDDALRLSPHDAYSSPFQLMRAEALIDLERYKECVEWAQQSTQSPNVPFWGFVFLAAALAKLDREEEAAAALKEVFQRVPDFSLEHVRRNLRYYPSDAVENRIDGLRKAGVLE